MADLIIPAHMSINAENLVKVVQYILWDIWRDMPIIAVIVTSYNFPPCKLREY